MKKVVLTGVVVLFAVFSRAQSYKKGDVVEVNKDLPDNKPGIWLNGKILDVRSDKKIYVIRGTDNKTYNIPFSKEDNSMRRPIRALNASMAITTEACDPTIDLVKQKIKEEFESDFSEYDSVAITYNAIEPQASYKNTDANFGKPDTDVFPFKIDVTVRLVTTNREGVQRKINWQFKRKYLLYQNNRGNCELTMAEREESLLSNI